MRVITFDIETEGALGNGDFSNLEVTVVGVHDSETGELTGYFKEELAQTVADIGARRRVGGLQLRPF